jgi:hypothetical protein
VQTLCWAIVTEVLLVVGCTAITRWESPEAVRITTPGQAGRAADSARVVAAATWQRAHVKGRLNSRIAHGDEKEVSHAYASSGMLSLRAALRAGCPTVMQRKILGFSRYVPESVSF